MLSIPQSTAPDNAPGNSDIREWLPQAGLAALSLLRERHIGTLSPFSPMGSGEFGQLGTLISQITPATRYFEHLIIVIIVTVG
jgi:hypothetical protein